METNTFSGAIQAPAVIDTPATRLFRGGGEFLGPYALVPASIAGMDLRGAVKLLLLLASLERPGGALRLSNRETAAAHLGVFLKEEAWALPSEGIPRLPEQRIA